MVECTAKIAEAQRRALPQRTQRRAGNNRKNKATKIDVGRDAIPPFFMVEFTGSRKEERATKDTEKRQRLLYN
jgi:hypothetical protein